MATPKTTSALPVEDQVKLVRDKLDDLTWRLSSIETRQRVQDNTLGVIKIELKDTHADIKTILKEFQNQNQKFTRWRSQIHDLIDKGFTTRARKLDEEVGVLNSRTVNLRKRVEKLETNVYNTS